MKNSKRNSLTVALAGTAALSVALAPVAQAGGGTIRKEGADRYETAVEVSKLGFADDGSADAVVLARGDDYADALTGAALAADKKAPLLLSKVDKLPAATAAELERVLDEDGTVYVLGGESAVSGDIEDVLDGLGYEVVRIQGENRYETAVAVADEIGGDGPVLLSTGLDFPDALSAGAAAGSEGGVVLLTNGAKVPLAVSEYLESREGSLYAIGGPAAAAAATLEQHFTAIIGDDRYQTAVGVAEEFFASHPGYDGFVLASGQNFADALAGGASSGRNNDPVLLAQQDNLPAATADYLTEASDGRILLGIVLGGEKALSDDVMKQTDKALNPPPAESPVEPGDPVEPPAGD